MEIPHGVADAETDIAFVAGRDGHVEAIAMGSGEVVARTDFPGTPLAVSGNRVYGWAASSRPQSVELFAADLGEGALTVRWRQAIDLPPGVNVASAYAGEFAIDAEPSENDVVFTWEAHARYRGGAGPPPEVAAAARIDEQRTIHVDAEEGTLIREDSRPAPVVELDAQELIAQRLVPYLHTGSWVNQPWQSAGETYVLAKPEKGPGLELRKRDVSPNEPRPVISSRPGAEPALTPDGQLLFLHEPDSNDWNVFDVPTGELAAVMEYEHGTESVATVNDRVLFTVVEEVADPPRRRRYLRCRGLASGEHLWSHLIGEEEIRGAPPLPR